MYNSIIYHSGKSSVQKTNMIFIHFWNGPRLISAVVIAVANNNIHDGEIIDTDDENDMKIKLGKTS